MKILFERKFDIRKEKNGKFSQRALIKNTKSKSVLKNTAYWNVWDTRARAGAMLANWCLNVVI